MHTAETRPYVQEWKTQTTATSMVAWFGEWLCPHLLQSKGWEPAVLPCPSGTISLPEQALPLGLAWPRENTRKAVSSSPPSEGLFLLGTEAAEPEVPQYRAEEAPVTFPCSGLGHSRHFSMLSNAKLSHSSCGYHLWSSL